MANSTVAGCALLADATAQLGPERRNRGATPDEGNAVNAPMTGRELRAQLKAQQGRNYPAIASALPTAKSCALEAVNDAPKVETTDEGPHYRWLILEADGRRREVCCSPPRSHAELAPCYLGARLVPLPDSAAEASELIHQVESET